MKRIPIKAAKQIAELYGYDQVMIYARKVGEDPDGTWVAYDNLWGHKGALWCHGSDCQIPADKNYGMGEISMNMILFWCPEGPRISYERHFDGDTIIVEDLNPESFIEFRMTPWELFKMGINCIRVAIFS